MAKTKAKNWTRDRAWLRKALKDAETAADWSAEKTAEVEARLRRILLRTLAAPQSDPLPHYVGDEACQVVIALEAARQEAELHRPLTFIINL